MRSALNEHYQFYKTNQICSFLPCNVTLLPRIPSTSSNFELLICHLHPSNFDSLRVLSANDAVGEDLVHGLDHDGMVFVILPIRVHPIIFFAVKLFLQFDMQEGLVAGGVLFAPKEHLADYEVTPILEAGGRVFGQVYATSVGKPHGHVHPEVGLADTICVGRAGPMVKQDLRVQPLLLERCLLCLELFLQRFVFNVADPDA